MPKLSTAVAEMNRLRIDVERCVMLLNKVKEIQESMDSVASVKDQLNKVLATLPGDEKKKIDVCKECKKYFLSYGKMECCTDCSSNQEEE
jgi:hypothetical protein